jgi:hypothetical protein
MRRLAFALAFAASIASTPAFADDPVPAAAPSVVPAAERASDADIDRLLQVMDAKSMMDKVMRQVSASQQAMVEDAFGKDVSDADRARVRGMVARTNAIMLKHMSWADLEPVLRKVYSQVFDKREVDAMIAFYSSREGASILKKTPQVLATSMQEIQPIIRAAMVEVKAMVDEETAARSKQ